MGPKDEPGELPTHLPPDIKPIADRPNSSPTSSQDSEQVPSPGERVDVRGTIAKTSEASAQSKDRGIIGSVLIEGSVGEDAKFDKAVATITSKTRLIREGVQTFAVEFATLEPFKTGQKVQARFTGPVRESYPVQATALEIVILK